MCSGLSPIDGAHPRRKKAIYKMATHKREKMRSQRAGDLHPNPENPDNPKPCTPKPEWGMSFALELTLSKLQGLGRGSTQESVDKQSVPTYTDKRRWKTPA